jgi:hypothetical protein
MDRVVKEDIQADMLAQITRTEVKKYVANSDTSKLYPILDDEQKLYAVVGVPHLPRPWPSRVIVMAQVVDDKVVIIEDITDKSLVDALVHNAGVPRDKIILAYKGETMPEAAG